MNANTEQQIRKILFSCSRAIANRPKDYDIILDEKGVNECIQALLSLIEQREAEAYKKGYVDGVLMNLVNSPLKENESE